MADLEKLKAVIHQIVARCGTLDNFGKTVLYKLLYFSDFDYYELHEKPLTGEIYSKLPRGPAPRNFDKAMKQLKSEGKIKEINATYKGHRQIKFVSIKEPEQSPLSADEIKHIEKTISKLSAMNATQISAYSHDDMPWRTAKNYDDLDYELVFYRDDKYSVREYDEICED